MEENKIYQNDNPKNGPLDGVQLRTDCVRTKFTQKRQKTGYPFKQSQTKANVSASVETAAASSSPQHAEVDFIISGSLSNVSPEYPLHRLRALHTGAFYSSSPFSPPAPDSYPY